MQLQSLFLELRLFSREYEPDNISANLSRDGHQLTRQPQDATSIIDAMHLPDPALTLTIPSLHDGLVLDCRIYHPLGLEASLSLSRGVPENSWRPKNAAIIAHPYAPLGGSYDDPIVEEVAGYLLAREFIVGTFNFRYVLMRCRRPDETGWKREAKTKLHA